MNKLLMSNLVSIGISGLLVAAAIRCGSARTSVVKPEPPPEDQMAAEQSVSQHDSDDYAKSMSEQNGQRKR